MGSASSLTRAAQTASAEGRAMTAAVMCLERHADTGPPFVRGLLYHITRAWLYSREHTQLLHTPAERHRFAGAWTTFIGRWGPGIQRRLDLVLRPSRRQTVQAITFAKRFGFSLEPRPTTPLAQVCWAFTCKAIHASKTDPAYNASRIADSFFAQQLGTCAHCSGHVRDVLSLLQDTNFNGLLDGSTAAVHQRHRAAKPPLCYYFDGGGTGPSAAPPRAWLHQWASEKSRSRFLFFCFGRECHIIARAWREKGWVRRVHAMRRAATDKSRALDTAGAPGDVANAPRRRATKRRKRPTNPDGAQLTAAERLKATQELCFADATCRIERVLPWAELCARPDEREGCSHAVEHLCNAAWARKYETIFTNDLNMALRPGCSTHNNVMVLSSAATVVLGEIVLHAQVRRSLARCRVDAEQRTPRGDNLLMVCGSSGPCVLAPHCRKRFIRKSDAGYAEMQQYARGFADILDMADTENFDVEFVAWTTENEVWLLGNYMPCSVLQREEIRCIIQHGSMPPVFQTDNVLTATAVVWAI